MFPEPLKSLGLLFENHGHQIRVVGGWVRDTVRGVEPKDIDLCTTALPDEMIALCQQHGLRYQADGIKHGTLGIILDHTLYDVTTLRIDKETDGRHATVEYTTDWQADAARRDFTINAMSMDWHGKLYDYFGGVQHLHENRIVFVGNPQARIREDYLRILRYFRFQGCLDEAPLEDRQIERIIRDNVEGLKQISAERIWSEMRRILSGKHLLTVLWGMFVTITLDAIGIESAGGDITSAVRAREATDNPITVLAALTGAPLAKQWNMSRTDASLLRWLQAARNGSPPSIAELKDIATTPGLGRAYAVEWAAMFGPENVDEIRNWPVPEFPVTGDDLMQLGMQQGRDIGLTINRLRMIWKSNDFSISKEALLSYLTKD